eukprot:1190935-Prorocentrum_minimum.AAC.9
MDAASGNTTIDIKYVHRCYPRKGCADLENPFSDYFFLCACLYPSEFWTKTVHRLPSSAPGGVSPTGAWAFPPQVCDWVDLWRENQRRRDRAVVLENGKVVEQGTHAELLSFDGKYVALQASMTS